MARIVAIVKALARALWRDQKSFQSVAGNNFFFVSLLLLQQAGTFLYLIIGLVLLFPLSTDPLRKIPDSRLALWPLERWERGLLRAVSPWVNPVTWMLAGLAVWVARGKVTLGVWAFVAGLFSAGFLVTSVAGRMGFEAGYGMWRHVPHFPGPLNQLVRKNLRELLSTLDFYCALALSAAAVGFRAAGFRLPDEARMPLTFLVVLALSSFAQCQFGLDGVGGLSRYRVLPLRGWQILAAKDVAFLLVAIVLTLPLAPLSGVGAALAALAMGHFPSVNEHRVQVRWRFSTGASMMFGLGQAVVMAMAAATISSANTWVVALCAGAYAWSTWWCGRVLEQQPL